MTRIPLNNGFTVVSLVGFIVSVTFTAFGTWDLKIGFTLSVMFFLFVAASLFSIYPEGDI